MFWMFGVSILMIWWNDPSIALLNTESGLTLAGYWIVSQTRLTAKLLLLLYFRVTKQLSNQM